MISRNDYLEIARVFCNNKPKQSSGVRLNQWLRIRNDFINLFEQQNPRFDRDRFITATEMTDKSRLVRNSESKV